MNFYFYKLHLKKQINSNNKMFQFNLCFLKLKLNNREKF